MWHQLTYDVTELSVPMGINAAFPQAFIAAGQSPEFAVFLRKWPNGRTITLYFSPASAGLALTNPRAEQCAKPNPAGIETFLPGNEALALFFPLQ